MTEDELTNILYELRLGLSDILADRMDTVYLYGSQARREAWSGSDIDVLIVLKGVFDYGEMLDRTIDLVASLSLDYNVVISRTFISKERFENEMSPFLMNVRREAVPA
jgi:predicted nucleotidyltransferase